MTDTNNRADLSALKLAELQALAGSLGIAGASKLRKGDLVNAIEEHDNANQGSADAAFSAPSGETWQPTAAEPTIDAAPDAASAPVAVKKRASRRVTSADTEAIAAAPVLAGAPVVDAPVVDAPAQQKAPSVEAVVDTEETQTAAAPERRQNRRSSKSPKAESTDDIAQGENSDAETGSDASTGDDADGEQGGGNRNSRSRNRNRNNNGDRNNSDRNNSDRNNGDRGGDRQQADGQQRQGNQGRQANSQRSDAAEGENDRGGRNRYRDRKRGRGPMGDDLEPEITEDDVLIPVAGILDVLDNYAFVRTSGYLPGNNDVYVSLGQVKKYNLRKGDAVVGAIRQPREGDANQGRQKYNA
ncbi:MAG: Rho termination factor N-terminal domain-containing protein, partial [Rhodoglobus sp.]|nr:Rho termination factor N-terminal domain-containing protein [Rhodoglobus sp.]